MVNSSVRQTNYRGDFSCLCARTKFTCGFYLPLLATVIAFEFKITSKGSDLVAAQKDLGGRISRFLVNLKKSGADNLTRPNLLRRRELLESYWRLFNERHADITSQAVPELLYLSSDYFSEVEEAYINQGSAIDELIEARSASIPNTSSIPASAEPDVALPPMKLPSFSGDLYQWESFRDQFCALVHDSTRIPKVRKMQYLKSCLSGDAAKMLDLTPITEASYDGAWIALERRFGNQRILTAAHMRRLISYPSLAKAHPSEIKRLLDEFRQTQRAFQALKKPVKEWDEWLVFLASEKLDQTTRLAWEVSLKDPTVTPSFDDLEEFLENRVHALGSARVPDPPLAPKGGGAVVRSNPAAVRNTLAVKVEPKNKNKGGRQCPLCSGNHSLSACKQFKALTAVERRQFVQKKGLCVSCFASSHQLPQCSSEFRCWACDGLHHTTLHDAFQRSQPAESSSISTSAAYAVSSKRITLLATARVSLEAPNGRTLNVRALLDSGSESSFLSEWAAQSLRLKRRSVRVELTGYQGTNVGTARSEVQVTLRSPVDSDFQVAVEALVTKSLTAPTPSQQVSSGDWPHIAGLPLADPRFSEPAQVDVLLGADVCGMLLLEKRVGPAGTPVAVRTPFGWTLLGPIEQSDVVRTARILHVRRQDPLPDLQRFWELEEVAPSSPLTPEELQCEELFNRSTLRDANGRYVVRLPFGGEERPKVGTSRAVALRMLLNAERNRTRDHPLREQYVNFMEEYRRLGHMERARDPLMGQDSGCYLTHHAVWKEADSSKKIRVVFNASLKRGSEGSLNDSLLSGPKLQSDLWAVITRWRLFKVAFSADIVKMFRQILIHPDDQDWLRILWRNDPGNAVSDFRLTTVTYGTAPAPYLAHRVLKQLAIDEGHRFPLGAQAIRTHSYVDDILTGADDLQRALEIRHQLTDLLASAGFQLDKWASNVADLRSACVDTKVLQDKEVHGALGLRWDVRLDSLAVRGPLETDTTPSSWSKRSVLSEVPRLFDPLGWLAPVIVRAKTIMQDLWLAGVSWDEPVDPSMAARWDLLRKEIAALNGIALPRWVGYSPDGSEVELHGFCDASERAYVATVYLVVRRATETRSSLLMGKTRVGPIKPQTIPRLELCGAVLLARLMASLQSALSLAEVAVHAWTDSTVALAWIRSHPSKWKPFVTHRVAEIQNLLPGATWRHVGTLDNPADLATRGISAEELRTSSLWWHGPPWLSEGICDWPETAPKTLSVEAPEQRTVTVALVTVTPEENPLVTRFSSLSRLTRVTAYLRRFVANCRGTSAKSTGPLTTLELREALFNVIRVTQRSTYHLEMDSLTLGKPIPTSSSLKALTPFVDDVGILRVGGRLQLSSLPEARRHPAIVDRTTHLATLIVQDAHQKTLHGGLTATLAWIHRAFWIPRLRARAKKTLRDCVTCTRLRASTGQQRMGDLPPSRVHPAKPFSTAGVDYAGPVQIRTTKGRGHKSHKGYIVVFVCLVSKAVHLDAVTDLTSAAFLAAFHRFVARRGRCSRLLSDNGTTFKGADVVLREMFREASQFYASVSEKLANGGTQWSFIPPYSPHMGGLWEAAVKSVKKHLRRVIGETTLTYEELATLLCRVEACLNSRPLTPLSDDPLDTCPLTPGHFLVGEPIHTPPEPPSDSHSPSLTTRWRLIHNLHDHFWRRWTKEYLHQLQQRPKWQRQRENVQIGRLVLVVDELSPPTRWPLARVTDVHPGHDGLVRVVTLRAGTRTFRRNIAKVVPLPTYEDSGKP